MMWCYFNKKIIFLFVLLFSGSVLFAQITKKDNTYLVNLKGEIIDYSNNSQSMKDAYISLLLSSDSSLMAFKIADSYGKFQIEDIGIGRYLLEISFKGYRTKYLHIEIEKKRRLSI